MSTSTRTLDIPSDPLKRRTWVLYQLKLRGRTISALARDERVTREAIYKTFILPNSHLEPVIAGAIGLTVRQLFSERFADDGARLYSTRERSRASRSRNVQQRGAA